MRRLLDLVQNIVQVRAQRVDVLGIQRRDERLVQPRENLMDDFVALFFQIGDPARCIFEPAAVPGNALLQQVGSLIDQFYLANEEVEEFVFARKQSHMGSKNVPAITAAAGRTLYAKLQLCQNGDGNVKHSRRNHSKSINAPLATCGKGSAGAFSSAPGSSAR